MYFEQLNPDDCKSYLIFNEENNSCIIIDPKLDYVDFYLNLLSEKLGELVLVIDTHTHADHLSGAAYLKEATGCKYAMYEKSKTECIDISVKDEECIKIEGIKLKFIYTPGHTEDSMCIIFEDKLFTGDTLFLDSGGGRDDLLGGDMEKHWKSLKRIKELEEYLIICPGHKYDNASYSTLWFQKKINPYLKIKSKREFISLINKNKPEEAPAWMVDVVGANLQCNKNIDAIKIPSIDAICQSGIKKMRQAVLYITPEELKDKIERKEDVIILDVRTKEEIANEYPVLTGSINIPVSQLSANLDKLKKYRDKEIIIICRVGRKSIIAYKILQKSGFNRVYVLQGGISAYREELEI